MKCKFQDLPVGTMFIILACKRNALTCDRCKKVSDWIPMNRNEIENSCQNNAINLDTGRNVTLLGGCYVYPIT